MFALDVFLIKIKKNSWNPLERMLVIAYNFLYHDQKGAFGVTQQLIAQIPTVDWLISGA